MKVGVRTYVNLFKQRIIKKIQMLSFCKIVQKHELYKTDLKRLFNKIFLSISDSVSVGTYRGKSSRSMARPQRTSVRCPVMVISRNGAGVIGGHQYT